MGITNGGLYLMHILILQSQTLGSSTTTGGKNRPNVIEIIENTGEPTRDTVFFKYDGDPKRAQRVAPRPPPAQQPPTERPPERPPHPTEAPMTKPPVQTVSKPMPKAAKPSAPPPPPPKATPPPPPQVKASPMKQTPPERPPLPAQQPA